MKLMCVLLLVPGLLAYRHFQERVPNGSRVPHPCKANYVWQGLGHMNKDGGGMRNAFGNDFDRNGQTWDRCLCEADSDGDGKTNGEELGDPDCEWIPGATPKITTANQISHPGICDPHDSAECQRTNNWDVCGDAGEFHCAAFDAPDVKNFTVKFPQRPVPAQVTTYMCILTDLPTDEDGEWQVIGMLPEIDNVNVAHHITVSLCSEAAAATFGGSFDEPAECGMSSQECTGQLYGWTVGMDGECLPDTYGLPIGKLTGYSKALVQIHWNNPEQKTEYTDASGIRYFYEPKKRPQDIVGGVMSPLTLHIPPKQLYYEQSSLCTAECSETQFNGTARHIISILPHMHYMGRGVIVEHYRGAEKLPDLVNIDSYSYDTPIRYMFDPPVEYRPGDEMILRCFYNSMNKDVRTFFGEATDDEMCMAFFSVYPGPGLTCRGDTDWSICGTTRGLGDIFSFSNDAGCNIQQYLAEGLSIAILEMRSVCDPRGLLCNPGCEVAIAAAKEHPCMAGDMQSVVEGLASLKPEVGIPFLHLLHSCDAFEVQQVPEAAPGDGALCREATSSGSTLGGILGAGIVLTMAGLMRRIMMMMVVM